MPVRSSMSTLIGRTRLLIADGTKVLTDQQLQDALDMRRTEQRHIPLRPDPTFQPGGGVLLLDFYSSTPNWEDDVLLQTTHWDTITATVSEPIVGHWSFATQPQGMAVRATGKTFDIYGSAADCLESWAAQLMLDFDFSDGQDRYTRSQKFQQLMAMAKQYRAQALVQTTIADQHDAAASWQAGPAVTYPSYGSDYGW